MNKKLAIASKAVILGVLTHFLSLTTFADTGIVNNTNPELSAVVTEKAIVINWTTPVQKAIDYVEVERSFNNQDYKLIGLVMTLECNANQTACFRFKDQIKNVKDQNIVYYRHKVIYRDGSVSYSPIVIARRSN